MKVAIALCLLWGLKSVLSLCHATKPFSRRCSDKGKVTTKPEQITGNDELQSGSVWASSRGDHWRDSLPPIPDEHRIRREIKTKLFSHFEK